MSGPASHARIEEPRPRDLRPPTIENLEPEDPDPSEPDPSDEEVAATAPATPRAARPPRRQHRKIIAVFAVLVLSAALILLMFELTQVVSARGQVDQAARTAAKAAADTADPTAGSAAARSAVQTALAGTSITCAEPVLTGNLAQGPSVTVALKCQVTFEKLRLLGIDSSIALAGNGTAAVNPYRPR